MVIISILTPQHPRLEASAQETEHLKEIASLRRSVQDYEQLLMDANRELSLNVQNSADLQRQLETLSEENIQLSGLQEEVVKLIITPSLAILCGGDLSSSLWHDGVMYSLQAVMASLSHHCGVGWWTLACLTDGAQSLLKELWLLLECHRSGLVCFSHLPVCFQVFRKFAEKYFVLLDTAI